jgi:hypothetical protein
MPAISVSTASSTHDGLATWNSRSSASGTNFTGTLVNPIIGPHYDTSLVYAVFWFTSPHPLHRLLIAPRLSTNKQCLHRRTN